MGMSLGSGFKAKVKPEVNVAPLVDVVLVLLIIFMGVYPAPFLERIDPTSQAAVTHFNLKRCASIRHAGAERPALLETLVDRCEDPVEVIESVYGDERPATQFRRQLEQRAAAQGGSR